MTMTVYVDPPRYAYRGMIMCHMWADSLGELLAMADAIGVDRRWLQRPPAASWTHFDISKGKRRIAIGTGAIEATTRDAVAARTLQLMRAL